MNVVVSDVVIFVCGLCKVYKQMFVLDNISFFIVLGCIIGLIGFNGVGKIMVFKVLLGLIGVEGDLQVLGMDLCMQ